MKGADVGALLGDDELGSNVGDSDGMELGDRVGPKVGILDGKRDGFADVGDIDGVRVGV